MEEIKQKVQDLELALNYVCYDASLIPKLTKVWEKLELLQEAVNKKCNIPHVIDMCCPYCHSDDIVWYGLSGDCVCNKCGKDGSLPS